MKQVQISEFEPTSSGQMAHFYRIENASGASVTLCDYGASVISLLVPDRQKQLRDVVLDGITVENETGTMTLPVQYCRGLTIRDLTCAARKYF